MFRRRRIHVLLLASIFMRRRNLVPRASCPCSGTGKMPVVRVPAHASRSIKSGAVSTFMCAVISHSGRSKVQIVAQLRRNCRKCPSFFRAICRSVVCFHTHNGFVRMKFYFSCVVRLESDFLLWGIALDRPRRMREGDFHACDPPGPFARVADHQDEYTHITRLLSSTM